MTHTLTHTLKLSYGNNGLNRGGKGVSPYWKGEERPRKRLMKRETLVWERGGCIRGGSGRNAGKPCNNCIFGFPSSPESGQKICFDHRNDHRQTKLKIQYPGIAELVPRHIWDVEIVRSSRTTRTITAL